MFRVSALAPDSLPPGLVVLYLHLMEGEVEGRGQRVRGAASKMSLVEDGEAT